MMFPKFFYCNGNSFSGGGDSQNNKCHSCCECCECPPCCELKKLCGAKFVLIDECGKEVACGITNSCGEILFDCLPCGKYCLKEVEAPCGYAKSCEVIEICVSGEKLHRHVEVINEKQTGSIKITKLGR